jgi:CRP-like cAMP-binding protein
VFEWFAHAGRPSGISTTPLTAHEHHRAEHRLGWAQTTEFDEATVRALPLFADLGPDELEIVLRSAREVEIGTGETVIHRWQGTRHFYTIVKGTVEIHSGSKQVRELGPGEFFGELAALDWGAGFGYARTAMVVASSSLRLLVLAPAALGELVRRAPAVERQVRAAARERLRSI